MMNSKYVADDSGVYGTYSNEYVSAYFPNVDPDVHNKLQNSVCRFPVFSSEKEIVLKKGESIEINNGTYIKWSPDYIRAFTMLIPAYVTHRVGLVITDGNVYTGKYTLYNNSSSDDEDDIVIEKNSVIFAVQFLRNKLERPFGHVRLVSRKQFRVRNLDNNYPNTFYSRIGTENPYLGTEMQMHSLDSMRELAWMMNKADMSGCELSLDTENKQHLCIFNEKTGKKTMISPYARIFGSKYALSSEFNGYKFYHGDNSSDQMFAVWTAFKKACNRSHWEYTVYKTLEDMYRLYIRCTDDAESATIIDTELHQATHARFKSLIFEFSDHYETVFSDVEIESSMVSFVDPNYYTFSGVMEIVKKVTEIQTPKPVKLSKALKGLKVSDTPDTAGPESNESNDTADPEVPQVSESNDANESNDADESGKSANINDVIFGMLNMYSSLIEGKKTGAPVDAKAMASSMVDLVAPFCGKVNNALDIPDIPDVPETDAADADDSEKFKFIDDLSEKALAIAMECVDIAMVYPSISEEVKTGEYVKIVLDYIDNVGDRCDFSKIMLLLYDTLISKAGELIQIKRATIQNLGIYADMIGNIFGPDAVNMVNSVMIGIGVFMDKVALDFENNTGIKEQYDAFKANRHLLNVKDVNDRTYRALLNLIRDGTGTLARVINDVSTATCPDIKLDISVSINNDPDSDPGSGSDADANDGIDTIDSAEITEAITDTDSKNTANMVSRISFMLGL